MMKQDLETEPKVVPFEAVTQDRPEVFGKLKRVEDPPIKSLLTWSEPEGKAKSSKQFKGSYPWVSEYLENFRSFTEAPPNQIRPASAFEPKPIPEIEEKPADLAEENSPSQSPKVKPSKTPKSGQKASKRQLERIKKLNQTTRWLANSSFKTYFGKPVFANYGQGNVNPAYGGLMYGDYMKTHNIAPHEGANNPKTQQVYEPAETKALQKPAKNPTLPRKCKDEDRLPPEEIEKLKKRSQILPKDREKQSKNIVKPDLVAEKIFKSEHHSPNQSINEGENKDTGKNKEKKTENKEKKLESKEKSQTVVKKTEKKVTIDKKSPKNEIEVEEIEKKNEEEEKKNGNVEENSKIDEAKSHDAEAQVEDCESCLKQNLGKLLRTSYQEMTSGVVVDKKDQIVEPFKYCAKCRENLYPEDIMRPPYSLGEIPAKELDPKTYKTLPPQWTQRIPAAGKLSYRSPTAYSVIFGDNLPLGGIN